MKEPPLAAFTSEISAKPEPVLQVALMATKPFHDHCEREVSARDAAILE